MTPSERLLAERQRIQERYGFYITPVRMAHLMEAAAKIAAVLIRADTGVCYQECRIVLDIVGETIKKMTGGDIDHDREDPLEEDRI